MNPLSSVLNLVTISHARSPSRHCTFHLNSIGVMAGNNARRPLIDSPCAEAEDGNISNECVRDESHLLFIVNSILSGTARLNVLLPTAAILAFTIFAPLLTNDGTCDSLNKWLIAIFVAACSASCVFLTFTDSFRTSSGRLYYGFATMRGMWTFNGGRKRPLDPDAYRIKLADIFHATLSLVAFLTFAASNNDVVACYYPGIPRKVINTVPLIVGFVISVLFVVFPSHRRGIGHPFLLHRDSYYF